MDILVTTCPVRLTDSKLRYFEYQCMRYVYNADKARFEPYELDLGSTNSHLHGWSTGVNSKEAANRAALIGANRIEINVPSAFIAIIQE